MLLPIYNKDSLIEVGCDEAGRGCLAGPVYAAAVILPADIEAKCPELAVGLNDSKQLSEKKRYALRKLIEQEAQAWAVGIVNNSEIDKMNILRASITAMHRAIDQLEVRPEYIIVDGNRFHAYNNLPHSTIVKGDGKFMSIAAASILAKTYRDDFMHKIHDEFPMYHWDKNKGYPSRVHRDAIRQYGATPYHRMTFNLLGISPQLEFDFG